MDRKNLAKAIYTSSHLTGSFELRSGTISSEYFDKYQFESDPELLEEIALHMIALLPDEFDMFAALEMGGIPIATMLSQKIGKPVVFVRKKAKEYGTKKIAEGADIENKKLVIVEDVVTSGGQIILSTKELRDRGAIVDMSVCVIDREAGGVDNLAAENIQLKPLFTMTQLKENKD